MRPNKQMIAASGILLLLPFAVFAQQVAEAVVTGNAAGAFASNYVWRGQKLSPETVIQPTVGVSYAGFTANLWSNNDLQLNEATETDLTLTYSFALKTMAVDFGYIHYAFDGLKDTQEFYAAASLEVLLSPTVTFYYDVDEGKGGFLIASLSYSVGIAHKFSLDFGALASANFNNAIMGVDVAGKEFTGLYHSQLSASLAIPVAKHLSVIPSIAYSTALTNDAKQAIAALSYDGDSSVAYGGVALSFDF